MKNEANERGTIEQGFQRAADGWHVVICEEGIATLKDKDDEEVFNKSGDALWKIPLKVKDEDDPSDDVEIDCLVAENPKGEQMVTDFLGATGLYETFSKKFPGDVSVFDDKVMGKVKTKLPGQMFRVKTLQNPYTDKSGNEQIAVNLIGYGKMSDTVADLEKELFPGSGDADDGADDAPLDDSAGSDVKNDVGAEEDPDW